MHYLIVNKTSLSVPVVFNFNTSVMCHLMNNAADKAGFYCVYSLWHNLDLDLHAATTCDLYYILAKWAGGYETTFSQGFLNVLFDYLLSTVT